MPPPPERSHLSVLQQAPAAAMSRPQGQPQVKTGICTHFLARWILTSPQTSFLLIVAA